MASQKNDNWLGRLLSNSRFWVLSFGLTGSVVILGLVQQFIAAGQLQTIRLEQTYAFVALGLLFLALLATPLAKVFPKVPGREFYLHSRRATGVLAFYYATLHASMAFFKQLKGFSGIQYFDGRYQTSLLVAVIALFILFLMAITSTDWAVDKLTFSNWKRLHRFVYLAGLLILLHVVLIGTHFVSRTVYFYVTFASFGLLAIFEMARVAKRGTNRGERKS